MMNKKGMFVVIFAFITLIAFSFISIENKEDAIPFTFSVTQGLSDDCFFEVKADGSVTLTIDNYPDGEIIKKSKLSANAIKKLNNYIEQVEKEEVYKHETMVCGDIQKFVLETGGKKYYMYWDGWFDGSADLLCRSAYVLYNSFGGNITAKREFISMVSDIRFMEKYSAYINYWEIYIKLFTIILILAMYICTLLKLIQKSRKIRLALWIAPVLIFTFVCGGAVIWYSMGYYSQFFGEGAYILSAFATVVIYPIYYAALTYEENKMEKILSILLTGALSYISLQITRNIAWDRNYINYSTANLILHYVVLPIFSFMTTTIINKIVNIDTKRENRYN